MSAKPVIGIPVDALDVNGKPFHGVGEKYVNAVAHGCHAIPFFIPAFGAGPELDTLHDLLEVDEVLDRIDGLFLTGSPSNVEPRLYGGEARHGDLQHDPQRDVTTLPIIRRAIERDLPILAVCRGYQELNVALGGTLYQKVQEVPGLMDHREDKDAPREQQYGPAHPVRLVEGGRLQRLLGASEIQVNSLHQQGLDRLADDLQAEAIAPDGLVEAVSHRGDLHFLLGVQWHPEWRFRENPASTALFAAFGEAAREGALKRAA
ncbi:MAG: gamma-glutamyl-gamma-aminobutyrate hydrolase family protein [Kiloniellales bacterium]|nr:gamma-glutamyl-gamma-aminobutyrate hydrolase family protein [Kiloniellales bacterium]